MKIYKRSEIGSGEPVNFVGVHPLVWSDRPEHPEAGFAEIQSGGAELIVLEREEQFTKHNYSVEDDVRSNKDQQLRVGAKRLLETYSDRSNVPSGWDAKLWGKMCRKSYMEKLIIAGALIAAEIDRLENINQ